jgi:hypothetical protein
VLHADEIWDTLQRYMRRGVWISVKEIYELIESHAELDEADMEPAATGHSDVRWRRNVRNVLQQKKHTKALEWDGKTRYRLL